VQGNVYETKKKNQTEWEGQRERGKGREKGEKGGKGRAR
jgi:hypothetical protein